MPSRHIAALLALTLLASAAIAAEVRLGSERALDPELQIGPAAFHQESPSVASNGRDFLAVWIDRRSSFLDAPLFVSRLGTDGRPFEPLGRRLLTNASDPHVASAGGDYLIAWRDEAGSNVFRVDENGSARGDTRHIHAARTPRELVSNGSTYLLLASANDGSVTATILDRDGAPLHTLGKTYGRLLWAGAFDGRYVVIAIDTRCDPGCQEVPTLHTIEETASGWSETTRVFLPYHADPSVNYAAVASRDRILVTSHTHMPESIGSYAVFDYQGRVVRGRTTLPGQVTWSGAAWDGQEFLLLFRGQTLSALRLERDGAALNEPFDLKYVPDIASNGMEQLLVWLDRRFSIFSDVVARAVDSFASLETAEEPKLVSHSGAAQYSVQVASADAAMLAVWKDSNGALAGAVGATPVVLLAKGEHDGNAPSIAAGSHNFLAVWEESDDREWKLLAKRIGFDGTILDAQPLVLASGTRSFGLMDNPGIAYGGSSFFVACAEGHNIHYARVTDGGAVLDRRVTMLGGMAASWPDPVWTGHGVLVPHTQIRTGYPGTDVWDIAVDGRTLFVNAGRGHGMKLASAAGRRRVTLAWMSYENGELAIYVAQITPEGKAVRGPSRVAATPHTSYETVSLAWNGSEYVLAWTDPAGMIRAMRLTHEAMPIDHEPFDVAMQSRGGWSQFTVTPAASGVAFGYDRIDAASGHVSRATTRTLERLSSAPSRRAVRH